MRAVLICSNWGLILLSRSRSSWVCSLTDCREVMMAVWSS